jgi:hypothetical protein
VSRSQPSTVAASSTGHQAAANSRKLVARAQLRGEVLLGPLTSALAGHLPPHRVDQRRGDLGGGPVAPAHGEQLAADGAELARSEVDHVVAVEHPELPWGVRHGLTRRAPQQLGHRERALHLRDRGFVTTRRADAVDDLAERAQRDRGLAEGGQHLLDVAHEHARRSDDEHAPGLVAATVAVQQERRAVQAHDRLAGARTTVMVTTPLLGRPDRAVLLGLDVRHDRVHRRVHGRGSAARAARPSPTIGRSVLGPRRSSRSSSTPRTVMPLLRRSGGVPTLLRVGLRAW